MTDKSEAKLLVESWVENLNETRFSPTSPDVKPDFEPRNNFESWFGVDKQKRIDDARAASGKIPQFQPELFGAEDRWSQAKSVWAILEPNVLDGVKTVIRASNELSDRNERDRMQKQAAKILIKHGVPEHASDGTHYLRSAYLGPDGKLVGVYHKSVANRYGYEAEFSPSWQRAFVPLEGQSQNVGYHGGEWDKSYRAFNADDANDVYERNLKPR